MNDQLCLVLDRLNEAGCAPRQSGDGWTARCPSHDDRNPSLSINIGDDGRVLVHCQAGCETSDLVGELGLKPADLFAKNNGTAVKKPINHRRRPTPSGTKPPEKKATSPAWATIEDALEELTRSKGRPTSIFGYDDAAGEPAGCVLRWDRDDGGKSILPIRRDPDGWRFGAMKAPRPLYGLMTFTHAPADETIYVVEGEKACDAAASAGLVATTSAGGSKAANKSDWGPLKDRDVVILPDNDEPGEEYATAVVRLALAAGAKSVRVIRLCEVWPAMPDKGDLADLVSDPESPWAGWENEDIRNAIESLAEAAEPIEVDDVAIPSKAKAGTPVMRNLSTVKPEVVSWLWPGRIPIGKLTLIAGLPGLGKSLLTLDIASRTSTASKWPDGAEAIAEPACVVLVSAEDDAGDTIRPRLDAAGADLSKINVLDGVMRADGVADIIELGDVDVFSRAIDDTPNCRLLVIDPVGAYVGGRADSYKDSDVRSLLAPLAALAFEKGVAILLVAHLNKSSGGAAIHRVSGSGAWSAATRASWIVTPSPDAQESRLLLSLKNNLAKHVAGMEFSIVDHLGSPAIAWSDRAVEESADDIFKRLAAPRAGDREDDGKDDDFVDRLCDWVKSQGGEVTVRKVQRNFNRLKSSVGLARDALDELVKDGLGGWAYRKSGTQRVEIFRLQGVGAPLPPTDTTDTDTLPPHGSETPKVSVSVPVGGRGAPPTPQPDTASNTTTDTPAGDAENGGIGCGVAGVAVKNNGTADGPP